MPNNPGRALEAQLSETPSTAGGGGGAHTGITRGNLCGWTLVSCLSGATGLCSRGFELEDA